MSGTTRTFDFWLAAASVYLYGNDALLTVTDLDRRTEFLVDVPQLDFEEIERQYRAGELAISDLNAFVRAVNFIKRTQAQLPV